MANAARLTVLVICLDVITQFFKTFSAEYTFTTVECLDETLKIINFIY